MSLSESIRSAPGYQQLRPLMSAEQRKMLFAEDVAAFIEENADDVGLRPFLETRVPLAPTSVGP